ncbi:hypothetical protein Pmani_027228 [Petrolisthes manimaculis]|uniref:Uncharacterized protein n=1 Tax=Petrolisthes manimaculis TaxID=1843537 RepID=A0AAE1TWP1_9EUCA|nr:hypothetical protein Pmani_027228 [Petrolisthes manimaculis]
MIADTCEISTNKPGDWMTKLHLIKCKLITSSTTTPLHPSTTPSPHLSSTSTLLHHSKTPLYLHHITTFPPPPQTSSTTPLHLHHTTSTTTHS